VTGHHLQSIQQPHWLAAPLAGESVAGMSNRPHRRRPRARRPARPQITTTVALVSALRDCTCDPDVSTRHGGGDNGGVISVQVAHDPDCPVAHGRDVAVLPNRGRRL
jgi:hypothetical protein